LLEELFAHLHERNIDVFDQKPEEQDKETPSKRDAPKAADLSDVPVSDPTDLYFREMGKEPLLTADEEVMLAKAVAKGLEVYERLTRGRRLSPRTVDRLEVAIEEGEAARRRLIRANTRLVISVAKRYVGQGVPFLDLVQEGNLGLMKAVDKFDYTRGYKFSTYATWWIRQAVSRATAASRLTSARAGPGTSSLPGGDRWNVDGGTGAGAAFAATVPASALAGAACGRGRGDDAGQLHRRR